MSQETNMVQRVNTFFKCTTLKGKLQEDSVEPYKKVLITYKFCCASFKCVLSISLSPGCDSQSFPSDLWLDTSIRDVLSQHVRTRAR